MKRMKKILAVVLSVVFVIGILPMAQIAELDLSGVGDWFINAFAAETVNSGTCGDNLTWELDNEGTLTISGTGKMDAYSTSGSYPNYYTTAPWGGSLSNARRVKNVMIKNDVSSIGNNAFYGCTGLTEVSIPASVTNIGYSVFYGCTGLAKITIPDSVTSIGSSTFYNCTSLTEITISDSITTIGSSVFSRCTGLTDIIIPDSVTTIESNAFYGCTGLTEITIPKNVTSMRSSFGGCTNLTTVNFAEGMTAIPSYALEDITSVTNVSIPDTVTTIGYYAFYGCTQLNEITIPASVTTINGAPFNRCTSLERVIVADDNSVYHSENNCIIENSTGKLVFGCKTSIIPSDGSVTVIGDSAFSSCTDLIEITIPNGVTSIGKSAFSGCTGLTEVIISDSVTSIGESAFSGCTGLTEITIPANLTSIGYSGSGSYYGIFSGCSNLTTVYFNEGIKTIPVYMLRNLTAVTTVFIPKTVTSIGNYAFSGCNNLADIYYADVEPQWATISMGTGVLASTPTIHFAESTGDILASGTCGDSLTWTLDDFGILTITGSGEMTIFSNYYNTPWYANSAAIRKVVFDGNVSNISRFAFYGCSGLKEIDVPDSVTNIGASAFNGCASLKTINIPDGVTAIDGSTFSGCTSLSEITIPASVTTIGANAFSRCAFERIELPENLTTLGRGVFSGSALTEITIPAAVTSMYTVVNGYYGSKTYYSALEGANALRTVIFEDGCVAVPERALTGCTKITNVVLPNSLSTIGSCAFYGCTALSSVSIPDSVTAIESQAFYGCNGLTEITISSNITEFGSAIFRECKNLTSVTFANGCTSIPEQILYQCSSLTTINLPDSITSIGPSAFGWCTSLEEVNIPNGVTSIGNGAFYKCEALTEIEIPNSVTDIGSSAFGWCISLTDVVIPDSVTSSIGSQTFYHCSNLKTVSIGNSVSEIGNEAFIGCSELNEVSLPSSVKSIGYRAFSGCSNLANVNFSNGLNEIKYEAFENCSGLNNISLPDSITTLGYCIFAGCGEISTINMPSSIVSCENDYIDRYDASDYNYYCPIGYCGPFAGTGITSVSIPDSLNSIPAYAFAGCTNISNISIPDGVTSIGDYAFNECAALDEIDIPDGVTTLGNHAFQNCTGLTEITIPKTVTQYGGGTYYNTDVFSGCANLKTIEFAEGTVVIPNYALYGASFVEEVIMPDSVTTIGNCSFQDCTALSEITIPDGVTTIGESAFSGCTALSEVSLPTNLSTIKMSAFNGVKLNEIVIPTSTTALASQNTYRVWFSAFSGAEINKVVFSDGITSIPNYSLNGAKVNEIIIPDSVTSIGQYAFRGCNTISAITLPANLTSVGTYAFYDCTSLSDVYYLASEEEWNHVTVGSNNDPLLNATFHYVHAHTFGDWVVTKEATCTEDGSHYKTCSDCGYVETEVIPALGHDFSTEWTIDTAMTCTVDEVKSHHCSRCDAKADVTVTLAPGHNYSAWTITREPTCTVAGSRYRSCSVCGNKETQSIPAPGHTYGDWTVTKDATVLEKGSKQRACSVCGYVDKVAIDRITIDIDENTNYGLANFTVVNAQTLQPISGASITISTDTDGTGTFTTDTEGKVSVVLPVGIQTVSARAAGTLVRNLQVEILSGTNDIPKIGLSDMNTYDAKLTATEMTYDEIVAAGIDPDAPENNHVFKYELQINFTAELDLYSLFYYMNSADEVVGGESSDESSPHAVHWYAWGEGTPGGYFYIEEEDITVVPVTENFYIIIRGQVKWLKEMFDVEMLVINNSSTDTLEDVVAELNLPEGLSLAAMVEGEQTLRQEIGTVEESSSKSVHWYVRGDVAGSYQLSAALTGKVMPFNEEINQTYTTENALQVWAGNALHLDFEFPDAAYYADDYPITITLTNVSDKTLYKLSHTLSVIEGMEYYYDDSTTKKKITKKDIMGVGVLDEFNPGDKIVIETNVNIFFKSELLEAQKEQLIGMVSGFEQLMKCYKAITSAYSAAETLIGSVSGAYSALTSYSASATSVFAGTAGKEKAEIAKKIYNAMAKLRKYTTTNNKIVDSVWNLFDATMSMNVVSDLKAIQQDPKSFFENNPISDLKSYYSKIKAVGEACEASVESASGVENYKFNLFDSIKTLISAIPIRFVVSSIVMTERAGSTTSIPYSVSTYSTGPHYFGVSDMSKYVMSITKMALAETINGVIPWYAKMFVNVDDILDTDEATKFIQATENEIKAFQAKESTGTTTWRAYVVRNENAQNQARFAKAKSGVSNGFEISCSNNNAVFEDGVLTFTGGAYIYVKPTSTAGGTLYIENSEGATYTYDISVVEAHSCVEGEKEIALAATQDRDGIAVTRCSVCNEIIDVTPITYSDCIEHSFSEWTDLYKGDCQTPGIRQRSCETCGYTETEMTEYGDHIPEYRNAIAATCTEAGYEGDIYCSVCEEYIDEGNAVPATGHNFGEWTVILPADCQNAGVEERVCANDSSHVETRAIPKTNHVDKNRDGLCDNCGTEMAYTHGGTDEDNNRCKYCGQVHEGFLGKFVGFFHKIAYFFAHLFGKM